MKEDIPGAAVNALTRITNKTVTDYTKSASAPPSTVNIKAVLAPNLAMNGPPTAAVKMIIFTIVLDPISQEVPVLPAAENISPALVKADMNGQTVDAIINVAATKSGMAPNVSAQAYLNILVIVQMKTGAPLLVLRRHMKALVPHIKKHTKNMAS